MLPTAALVLLSVPLAVAQSGGGPSAESAATGDTLREGVRNPTSGSATGETELIGDIGAAEGGSGSGKGGYVLRESNLSSTGGGPVHGCRAVKGNIDTVGFDAARRDTKPCIRVNNLSDGATGGRAFEFAFGGPLGGLIEHATGGDGARPFATNATGVAVGLNADRVDGRHGSALLGRTEKAADADLLDGQDSASFLGRTEKAADSDLLDGQDSTAFETASAFASNGTIQAVPLADTTVESAQITTTGAARILASASIEANADGGDDDTIACRANIAGEDGQTFAHDIPDTISDQSIISVMHARVLPAGTHSVAVICTGIGTVQVDDVALTLQAIPT